MAVVKDIDWVEDQRPHSNGLWGNGHGIGSYMIREGGDGYFVWKRVNSSTSYIPDDPGIEAAKAAAQDDFERRVRAALV